MKTLELVSRSLLQLLLAACAATLCIRLCTGCTYLKALHEQSKPTVVFALKEAYANGGATAVSNKIEQLVIENAPENRASDLEGRSRSDGEAARKGPRKVTPAQATQLHILAQRLYDGVVQHLETTDLETALAPTNAPAIQ